MMEAQQPDSKALRRRQRSLSRILLTLWGYALSGVALSIAHATGLSAMPYMETLIFTLSSFACVGFQYLWVYRQPGLTKQQGYRQIYIGLSLWYPLFFVGTILADGVRQPMLLLSMLAVIYLLTAASAAETFIAFLMVGLSYLLAVVIGNHLYGTEFSWAMELYYLGLYCVVGFVFGILGGVLSRQRKESLEAKKLQLRHARDLMIQSEKLASMGQMVASIGHEIANPVSAAQNATYIMENNLNELESFSLGLFEGSENDPDAQKVRDEMIQQFGALRSGIAISVQAAEKLKDLSHALRTQSRMETKVTEGVDLNKVVQESIVLVSGRTIQHQLEEVLAELPEIQCMRSRIGQVVTNLLANAADALTERSEELGFDFEGKIVISSQAETHNGTDGVSIVIADNGTGVPETIREKIFEEFFTTKPAGVGTGLGLAMCASIVRDHGGSLQVTDDPALGGARFEVWLPMLATSSDNPQLH